MPVYRPYFDRAMKAEKKATILDLAREESVSLKIRIKGCWEKFENVKIHTF